jgi:hypothetical protein
MRLLATARAYADPEAAARELIELANAVEAVQDGPHPHRAAQRADAVRAQGHAGRIQRAGLKFAIERGWRVMHESGTYVKFTQVGAELFA